MCSSVVFILYSFSPSPKAVYNGLEAVQKIINEKQIDGVYGPLIENITCDEKFFTAVEVTAGGR